MPDWNPAELIGLKPRPLAYSLYDTIITSRAWAVGRVRLGYRDLRSLPLMHQVGGTPFILVSASLMSFVPGGVPEHVARQVVTVAQRLLRESPEAHDKVEFAIMPTCYKSGLNDQEWRDRYADIDDADWAVYVGHLRDLTNSLIGDESFSTSAVDRTASLHALVDELRQRVSESSTAIDGLSLLRAAEAHGTELFSEVARSAFIATDILADLERSGAVPPGLLDDTVAAASTVGAELVTDHAKLPLSEFLNKYGHVRPGTYDVTVTRYDETPAEYFAGGPLPQRPGSPQSESAPWPASDELDALLREIGYEFSWEQLIEFATTAISLREEVKHAFTKLLSDAMEIFVRHCARHGIDRELVSFLSVSDFERSLRSRRTTNQLTKTAIRNRKRWRRENDVRLPDLLTDVLDIRFGQENLSQPTFVTRLRAEGPVTDATSGTLSGAVVFLECADPGHDWIFTHGIAGFVTQFGGENSHMAIRARELQVPAVIGAGSRYERWSRSDRIVIDGRSKTVEMLG